jgi:uncharacterized protein YndB with AHSA1/START domain
MGKEFSVEQVASVDASIAETWDAIATGPGIDSWFMGRTEVADGHVRTVFGDYAPDATITENEPGRRFAYAEPPEPDGRFIAYEFLIEGRTGAATSIRLVTSGFLPDDDWADEFEAMTNGGALFFRTLVEYLQHFAGRDAVPVTAFGPMIADWPAAWAALGTALGLDRRPRSGDAVRLGAADGTVYFANRDTVGVRTSAAIYRFVRGFHGPILAMHHIFEPTDILAGSTSDVEPGDVFEATAESETVAWTGWLHRTFGE